MIYSEGDQVEVTAPTGGYIVVEIESAEPQNDQCDYVGTTVFSNSEVEITCESIVRKLG